MRRFLANGGLSGQAETPWRFYPTTLRLPVWARPLTLPRALRTFKVSELRARVISREFRLERGLMRSPYKPTFRPVLDPADILNSIRAEAPVDGREIVEWMQISDIKFNSETGSRIRTRGFAIATTPRGSFNVPSLGKNPGVFRDLISWGSISYVGTVQWIGSLLKWKSLAETPIRQTVGFYRDYRGNSAPNFFVQRPTRPALTVRARQRFSTDEDQTLTINFRDPTNYTRVVGSRSVDIARGESEVTYTVSAFPYVPPTIAEIQPEDDTQTKLEEFVVT